jgi:hypothetical protein
VGGSGLYVGCMALSYGIVARLACIWEDVASCLVLVTAPVGNCSKETRR